MVKSIHQRHSASQPGDPPYKLELLALGCEGKISELLMVADPHLEIDAVRSQGWDTVTKNPETGERCVAKSNIKRLSASQRDDLP